VWVRVMALTMLSTKACFRVREVNFKGGREGGREGEYMRDGRGEGREEGREGGKEGERTYCRR